ncbi:histone acetylation protein-domain-containing protein [Whalleya microplaca]|nr:histone acetylation protein-domain-containing protein [Whalleya microplaca]
MASPRQPRDANRVAKPNPLIEELAKVLPKDRRFTAYHLSTTPTITEPLCHPPAYNITNDAKASGDTAGQSRERRPSKPLKTYVEKHFLAISVGARQDDAVSDKQVLVLGLEIYIYTTAFSTIIFVAKADSTGYLHVLNLPKGTPSPIREVTACFIAFLIASRRRRSKQLVVNLFARAQSQYLFPGSVKNSGKHVLDDRGLVKWWCQVLNPLLEDGDSERLRKSWDRVHGYLMIPGLDNYETRAFLPRTSLAATNWTLGHPLEEISPYSKDSATYGHHIPPRCLIPTYPDDPKARFVQELEESTSERTKLLSGWKSPRTLDQFWEMMAFRQECSSGRLTGFVWIVLEPRQSFKLPTRPNSSTVNSISAPSGSLSAPKDDEARPSTPISGQQDPASLTTPTSTPSKPTKSTPSKPRGKRPKKKVLRGPIIPRKPQIKTHHKTQLPDLIETPYYYWPEVGRGQVVLNDNSYNRAVELLLHLEFSTLDLAITSTARWTGEVNMGQSWALDVIGKRESPLPATSLDSTGTVNNLSGMIRRKRPAEEHVTNDTTQSAAPVNTLSSGLIRKKVKHDASAGSSAQDQSQDQVVPVADSEPKVNILGAGLIRKRAKEN